MRPTVRPAGPADHDDVVALALRAFAPVFTSMRAELGDRIDELLHGADWRVYQAAAVREILGSGDPVWVAIDGSQTVGFASARIADPERRIGELAILAVDPDHQRHGTGGLLTVHATDWLRTQGMLVAALGTGGDAGHAPARRTYEAAGYTLLPHAMYFRAL